MLANTSLLEHHNHQVQLSIKTRRLHQRERTLFTSQRFRTARDVNRDQVGFAMYMRIPGASFLLFEGSEAYGSERAITGTRFLQQTKRSCKPNLQEIGARNFVLRLHLLFLRVSSGPT